MHVCMVRFVKLASISFCSRRCSTDELGEAFMRAEHIMCLNLGRSKGEDCGHVK